MTARLSWVAYIQYFVIGILLYLFVVSSAFAVISGMLGLALGKSAAQTVFYGLTLLYLVGFGWILFDFPVAVPIWMRPVYGITAVCFRGLKAFAAFAGKTSIRRSTGKVFLAGLLIVIPSTCSIDMEEALRSKTCITAATGARLLMIMPLITSNKGKEIPL